MRMSKVEIGSKLCNRFQASHGKEIDHVKWVRKLSDYWGNMRIVVVQWEEEDEEEESVSPSGPEERSTA
jgi:hypothetical protein